MIKIAVADDQSLFRNMLIYILEQEPSFEVVGGAADGIEVVELCKSKQPDIVLLDVKMPKADGISALMKIKELNQDIKVVMLTTFEEGEYIYKACSNAADGYIVKDTKPEALVNVVKCVSDGFFVIHPSANEYLMKQMTQSFEVFGTDIVSDENLDFDTVDRTIIRLVSIGKNNAEIAAQINYSEGTVKNRISRMLAITGTKDRTQLAIFALHNGIV